MPYGAPDLLQSLLRLYWGGVVYFFCFFVHASIGDREFFSLVYLLVRQCKCVRGHDARPVLLPKSLSVVGLMYHPGRHGCIRKGHGQAFTNSASETVSLFINSDWCRSRVFKGGGGVDFCRCLSITAVYITPLLFSSRFIVVVCAAFVFHFFAAAAVVVVVVVSAWYGVVVVVVVVAARHGVVVVVVAVVLVIAGATAINNFYRRW